MSHTVLKQTVNQVFQTNGKASVQNFATEFADACKLELFFNLLFQENVAAGIKPTTDINTRIKNWQLLNREIFSDELSKRVFLDMDSMKELASGKSEKMILKLLKVFLGIHAGTAEAYATDGQQIELGDINDQILIQQEVTWTQHTEYRTASDTSDEERKTGISREKVYQAAAKRSVVEHKRIEQAPLIEEYSSEEIVNEVRRKPRRQHVVVREETESEEEVVEIRKKAKARRQVVQHVEETVSESAEEIIQHRKPVVKQRVHEVEPKMQQIFVEEPQTKITRSAKQTIKVPVQVIKKETVHEEHNIETQADRDLKWRLEQQKIEIHETIQLKYQALQASELEIEQARKHLANLELQHRHIKKDYEAALPAQKKIEIDLKAAYDKPTTEMRARTFEKEVTEYHDKKVRKKITETPISLDNWQAKARAAIASSPSHKSSQYQSVHSTTGKRATLGTGVSETVQVIKSPHRGSRMSVGSSHSKVVYGSSPKRVSDQYLNQSRTSFGGHKTVYKTGSSHIVRDDSPVVVKRRSPKKSTAYRR